MSDLQIKVGGYWLSTIAPWGGAVVTHRRQGGCWSLDWNMDVPFNWQHPAMKRGVTVEAWDGMRCWIGTLAEPNWEDGSFSADGSGRQLETMVALNLTNKRVTEPGEALFWASSRLPLSIGTLETFSNITPSGESDKPNYVADLMDAWATQEGQHWWVDHNSVLWVDPDPTKPQWVIPHGAGLLGVADEEYATHWYCAYYSSTTHRYEHVLAGDSSQGVGRVERMADLTKLGPIGPGKAQTIANNILAKTKARTGWANGITVKPGQITNLGGNEKVALSAPRAGHMVRLQGLQDQRGMSANTDVVIEESIWNVDDDELVLNPVGLAARDFAKIVESFGGVLVQ